MIVKYFLTAVLAIAFHGPANSAAQCGSTDGAETCSCNVKCWKNSTKCGCEDGLGKPSPNLTELVVPIKNPGKDNTGIRIRYMPLEKKDKKEQAIKK